jgi:hypothetical protein
MREPQGLKNGIAVEDVLPTACDGFGHPPGFAFSPKLGDAVAGDAADFGRVDPVGELGDLSGGVRAA